MAAWLSREDDARQQPRYWLEFQVCSDGLEEPPAGHVAGTGSATGGTGIGTVGQQPPSPPTEFGRFGDLPAELRLRIWELLRQPRIVIVACVSSASRDDKRAQLALRPRRPAVPLLLRVCRESRAVGLRHWERAFAWRIGERLCGGGGGSDSIGGGGGHWPGRGGGGAGVGAAAAKAEEERGSSSEARVWFNFAADTLLLLGELEPFDRYGFNSPMVYFLRREDCLRVRHVACAFEELGYGVRDAEQVFGCLFHIVDRFPGASRMVITSTARDVEVYGPVLLPPPLQQAGGGPGSGADENNNIVQKIWHGWMAGRSVVTLALAATQILMVREDGLASFLESHDGE